MAGHGRTGRQGGATSAVKAVADAPQATARPRRQPPPRNVPSARADTWRCVLAGLCDAVWRVDSRGACLEVLRSERHVVRRFPSPTPRQRLHKLLPTKVARIIMGQVRRSIETGKANSCKLGLGFEAWVMPWTSQDVLVAIRDNCELDRLRGELARSQARLHDVVDHLHRAREAERIRIARELHDEMGQMLTVLKMDLARMRAGLDREDRHLEKDLAAMMKNVGTLVRSVQNIVAELRPKILEDFGLLAAVEWQVQRFRERTGVRATCTVPDGELDINPEQASALYRIVQEALTNVARHADAHTVSVVLRKDEGGIEAEILDDGHGVEWRDGRGVSRLGVLGMQERARSLGGEASITPRSGGGTRVWVRLPDRIPAEWPFVERRRGLDRRRFRRGREPEITTRPGQEREESTMGE